MSKTPMVRVLAQTLGVHYKSTTGTVLLMRFFGIQYYDALIISAAEKLGCHEIITEDLNPNQLYRGMASVNPFAED